MRLVWCIACVSLMFPLHIVTINYQRDANVCVNIIKIQRLKIHTYIFERIMYWHSKHKPDFSHSDICDNSYFSEIRHKVAEQFAYHTATNINANLCRNSGVMMGFSWCRGFMQCKSLKAEETEAQMKCMRAEYSLIWATGSVPDVLALLPCEQEPSGEDDGYSSTRTQQYTMILDMFPHECYCIRLRRAWQGFFLSFCFITKPTQHFLCNACATSSDDTADKSKWEMWIIPSNCSSTRTHAKTVWFSLRSGGNSLA